MAAVFILACIEDLDPTRVYVMASAIICFFIYLYITLLVLSNSITPPASLKYVSLSMYTLSVSL